jgi:protein-S-isoprenylcysteine O-methyltransferase Ste14/Co/Zn/Cd efflux system component
VDQGLAALLDQGWAVQHDGYYTITDEGRTEAERMLEELKRSGRVIETATRPSTVSAATLVVHFVLGAIKLPAAVVSGSVGLLNDALDTLMDGVSSLFVLLGIRSGRERLVSYLLLVFMGATGLYSLYEAIRRFFVPDALSADPIAFVAVVASGTVCALLWVYQKYCGLKHSSVPLIAQSVDSRNHVIVAVGVGVGLLAAHFELLLLDQLVGLGVALLILKGAVELLVDLVRSGSEDEVDLSRYGFTRLESHRHRQLVRWFLYEIETGRVTSRSRLQEEVRSATDFSRIASFRALGIEEQPGAEAKIARAVDELFGKELARESDVGLELTEGGRHELERALARSTFAHAAGAGPPSVAIRAILFCIRAAVSAVLYAALYLAGEWVLSFVPAFELWDAASIPGRLTIPIGSLPTELNAAQAALVAAGFVLFHGGRTLAHRARRFLHRGGRVVTEGPYWRVRHPMAAGLATATLGLGIALHSAYALGLATFLAAVHLVGAATEDRRLRRSVGDAYRWYARRVPGRYLTWPAWLAVGAAYAGAWLGAVLPL